MFQRRALLTSTVWSLAALALPAHAATKAPPNSAVRLNIRDFGAAGDGQTKDTLAVQQALDRCAMLGGGEVVVPAGTFLIGAVSIGSNTTLRLDPAATLLGSPDLADYPLSQVRWEGKFIKGYLGLIGARYATNIAIAGKGRIVASQAIKRRVAEGTGWRHPSLMEFVGCKSVHLRDLNTQGNDMWSIHPIFCEDVSFSDMIVNGGADGIDVDSCRHVVIERCSFDTADDCIAIKSGRGEEGYTLLRTCEDVRISDCVFKDRNFACMSVGSETSGGIRGVRVERCEFLLAKTHAVYIKSRPGRGAFIEDIVMTDLKVSGVQQGFLRFNILNSGKQDEAPVPGADGIPTIRNFAFSNIQVVDVPELVDGDAIHPAKPLDGLTLANITGTCRKGIKLANIRRARLNGIRVTGFSGPLLSIRNVTGSGLANASILPAAKDPDPVPAPAKPYILG